MADYDFHKPQKLQFNFLATTNCIYLSLVFYLESSLSVFQHFLYAEFFL